MRTIGSILLLGAFAAGLFFAFKQGEKKGEKSPGKKEPSGKQPINDGKATTRNSNDVKTEINQKDETQTVSKPPQKDLVDKMFDLSFEKIRQSDLYKSQSDLKRGIIDTTIIFIDSNKAAKEKIKHFAEANKIPIENAIILELFPKK